MKKNAAARAGGDAARAIGAAVFINGSTTRDVGDEVVVTIAAASRTKDEARAIEA